MVTTRSGAAAPPSPAPSVTEDSSVASPRGTNQLSGGFLQELAELIEENGGIATLDGKDHTLRKLLDQDTNRFGQRSDPLRTKIRNKVYRWILRHRKGTYEEEVLKVLKVTPSALRPWKKTGKTTTTKRNTPKSKPIVEDDISVSGSDSSTSDDSKVEIEAAVPLTKGQRKQQRKQQQKQVQPPGEVSAQLKTSFDALSLHTLLLNKTDMSAPPNTGTFPLLLYLPTSLFANSTHRSIPTSRPTPLPAGRVHPSRPLCLLGGSYPGCCARPLLQGLPYLGCRRRPLPRNGHELRVVWGSYLDGEPSSCHRPRHDEQGVYLPREVHEGLHNSTVVSMSDARNKVVADNRKTINILLLFPTPKDSAVPTGIKLEAEPIFENVELSKNSEKDTTMLELQYFPVEDQQYAAWYVACTDVHSKDTRGPEFGMKPSAAAKAKAKRERRIHSQQQKRLQQQDEERARLQSAYNQGAADQSRAGATAIPDHSGSMEQG